MPSYKYTDSEGFVNIVPAGEYPFFVMDSQDKISKSSGNDMIEVKLSLETPNGDCHCWDYLTFSEKSAWKIDTFLKACGRTAGRGDDVYLDAAMVKGWSGRCVVEVDNSGDKARMKVVQYVRAKELKPMPKPAVANAEPPQAAKPAKADDDNLPF